MVKKCLLQSKKKLMTIQQYKSHVPSYLRGMLHQDMRIIQEKENCLRDEHIEEIDKKSIRSLIVIKKIHIANYIRNRKAKEDKAGLSTAPTSKQVSKRLSKISRIESSGLRLIKQPAKQIDEERLQRANVIIKDEKLTLEDVQKRIKQNQHLIERLKI